MPVPPFAIIFTATPTATGTVAPTATSIPTVEPVATSRPVVTPSSGTSVRVDPSQPQATPTPIGVPTQAPAANTPTPTLPSTPTPPVTPVLPTQISFVDVRPAGSVPSLVEISFSLRDDEGRAVVVQSEALHSGMRMFEDGLGTDGWEEIDLAETSFFVQAAENLDLEIVFILDFTNSMAITTGADGRSGIEVMLAAFEGAVASLPGSHRIGVVEFHDRNFDPTILSEPTIDRGAVLQAVRNFANSGFEPGSSRVWDSIEVASSLFTRRELSLDVVRGVVFISDGRDTSSVNTRSNAREIAERQEVQLYALGVGDVFEPDELAEMAEDTGGKYYSALEIGALQEQLAVIVSDLRGQYKVNYTTLRRQGTYASRIEVDLPTMVGALETPA